MNDRFKFRVWNIYNKRYMNDINLIGFGCLNTFQEVEECELDEKNQPITYTTYEMNEVIVEQCTGLKDKNGNLIYEGDIMEHRIYLGNPELYVVKWSESVNGWVYQDVRNSLKTSYILTEFTDSIIGNIHENKELLDGR